MIVHSVQSPIDWPIATAEVVVEICQPNCADVHNPSLGVHLFLVDRRFPLVVLRPYAAGTMVEDSDGDIEVDRDAWVVSMHLEGAGSWAEDNESSYLPHVT
jgi:hypothetical protein